MAMIEAYEVFHDNMNSIVTRVAHRQLKFCCKELKIKTKLPGSIFPRLEVICYERSLLWQAETYILCSLNNVAKTVSDIFEPT